MSVRLYIRDSPQRSLALITETHTLIFRQTVAQASQSTVGKFGPPRCMVEFADLNTVDLHDYKALRTQGVYGTLGLININADVFLCIISNAERVAVVRPEENVQRIISVDFYCLNRDEFDQDELDAYDSNNFQPEGYDYARQPSQRDSQVEHPCQALKKLLGDGTFYYSVDFDLTNSLQNRVSEESAFDPDSHDKGFLWNSYMITPLVQFRSSLIAYDREALDASLLLTSAIRGYVSTITVPASSAPIKNVSSNLPSSLTLISRLSCRRAGTRFNSRGIDDDGNVANFVETETTYWFAGGLCFSYAQVRGSVPIFWEQSTGILPNQQKIQITRSPEATQPSFDKHFEDLELRYGAVHILNLMSATKPGEVELTERYKYHVGKSMFNHPLPAGEASDHRMLQYTQYDFHAETKGANGYEAASSVKRLIRNDMESSEYFLSDSLDKNGLSSNSMEKKAMVSLQQEGVIRTNCLDCLDRTNLIQTIISQMALESFLNRRGEYAAADFWMRHSSLWADNGDALSKIYAGTGALKSSFTRHGKMSLAGALADARKSATRVYINNFVDKGRQNTIDILLGRLVDQSPVQLYDPMNEFVSSELYKRTQEYSSSEEVSIWVGTFNLNGKRVGLKEDLSTWLYPKTNSSQSQADIVAVGFQEIVELSPQQIMSTDPDRRQEWEIAVGNALNVNARRQNLEEYILLRSGQLVGTALIIFVKAHTLKDIKNVEGSVKKTGLSGMAGNKGAVAIRMEYANTRICFVTAHLAAGFANYDERNKDYRTISHGLRFQRDRSIEDHDTIIWLGDFNYRIGLAYEKVLRLVEAGDLGTLYQNDQLNLQMVAGQAFPFYSEASITFMPTYKYDVGTDYYDTSEKARIPAWCDRVLRKGNNLTQINYNTAPLRFSDHRPIYATFLCTVNMVNETLKEKISRDIYKKRQGEVSRKANYSQETLLSEKDDLIEEGIAPGLPPASSDSQKWWLANGLPVRSTVADSRRGQIPNPKRPSNPFTNNDEPDWIKEEEATERQSQYRSQPVKEPGISLKSPQREVISRTASGVHRSQTIQNNPTNRRTRESSEVDRSYLSQSPSSRGPDNSTAALLRKPAPPVPKKPVQLISPEITMSEFAGVNPIERLNNASAGASTPPPPPPPRRVTKTIGSSILPQIMAELRPQATSPDMSNHRSNVPPLPQRSSSTRANYNLLDEEIDAAGDIPSLKPNRPK